jgi:hypothetical protein
MSTGRNLRISPDDLQLEHVTWIDSHGHDGWAYTHELDFNATKEIDTVGWLVDDNAHSITTASHYTDGGDQLGGIITIPKIAILSRRVLATLRALRQGAELFEVLPTESGEESE